MKITFALLFALLSTSLAGQQGLLALAKQTGNSVLSDYFAEKLKVLSHDSMEGRATLGNGIRKAERHIVSELEANGVNTYPGMADYLQEVPFLQTSGPEEVGIYSKNDQLVTEENIMVFSGKDLKLEGDILFVNLGMEDDLEGIDLRDKWVIAMVGNGKDQFPGAWLSSGQEKAAQCREKGALGLIEIFQPGKMPWQMIKSFQSRSKLKLGGEGFDFPHLWVNPADSTMLPIFTSGNAAIRVVIEGMNNELISDNNIVAYIPGTDPALSDEMIIFSAHYDHVGIGKPTSSGDSIYNGARDNAVGVATLLALSRHFTEYRPGRPLMFVFFTAEERGLLGSKYFVEHCPAPLDQVRFNFNCDNGGYTDTDMISIVGFHRLQGMEDIDDWLAPLGMRHYEPVALAKRLFYASDNANFASRGIPAPSFSMGFTAMNEELLKYYHQAIDHWDNFDRAYMEKYWNGIFAVAKNLVSQEELPYWRSDDPLYQKANDLYGRTGNGK